jgi:hypothetical protein
MARCIPASAGKRIAILTGSEPSPYARLRTASLILFAGALIAAATVVAARVPGSQAAYGPPPASASLSSVQSDTNEGGVTTATSSTLESPRTVASSWSMSPLQEAEGGTVSSSTSMDPVTQTSSGSASPQ